MICFAVKLGLDVSYSFVEGWFLTVGWGADYSQGVMKSLSSLMSAQ